MVCRRLIALVLVCAVSSAGCTSMRPIRPAAPGQAPFGPVRPGDTVAIQTRDGVRARFVVHLIDGETLVAVDGRRFARPDLASVERKTYSGLKTAILAASLGTVALMLAVGLWLAENSA